MKTVTDYLDSLTWDGTPRLDRWLINCAGAEDNAYVQDVSRLMLVAAVRRIRNPGCLFDEMPFFFGEPQSGTLQALRVLAVEDSWFSDKLSLEDTQKFWAAAAGKWIVAACRIERLCRNHTDVSSFKAILSRRRDFGPKNTRVPRQFVIVGTTNETEGFLIEATGNRRCWPIRVQRFDLDRLRNDRDQLWAEAAVANNGSLRIDPKLFAVTKQPAASSHDIRPDGKKGKVDEQGR